MRVPSADFWRGRRVLVTGHTGFKGAWMTLLLDRLGAEVHGLSLPDPVSQPSLFQSARLAQLCRDARGDVVDARAVGDALTAARPSVVIHMAAQALVRRGFREPLDTLAVNVMGVAHVLDACRRIKGVEAVAVVTSDKCYENKEQLWPYRESDAMGGHDPYSASKGAAELVAASYARTFFADAGAARVATVRAGNVIGGGDWAQDRLMPDLVRAAVRAEPVEIRNPSSVRPWQHVLDPLAGYLLAVERMVGAAAWSGFDRWNFGPNPGEELAVREVATAFQHAWAGKPDVRFGQPQPSEHEAGLLRVDSTKARVQLGWRPCADNLGAIGAAVRWYRAEAEGGDPRALAAQDIERFLGL